ncbi:MAG: endonuclease/exonuclease/phosphatase family protein, partial [Flavobacteriales bacterium]
APVLLVGDFNMEPTDKGIQLLKSNYHDLSCRGDETKQCAPATFNGFTKDQNDDKRIDYIFGSDKMISLKSSVIVTSFGLSYPSDHFPVLVVYKVLR